MAVAKRLKLRLFVEGVEIPCISAVIQTAPNSPIGATIQVLPLEEGTKFLPRSLVHLFFLDLYEEENPGIRTAGIAVTKKPGPSVYDQMTDEAEKRAKSEGVALSRTEDEQLDELFRLYKVCFFGELMGFQWVKGSNNRALVLQCSDLSNLWDYAYQFNNSDLFGPGINAMFSGGSTNLFTDLLSSPGEIATQIIMTPSTRYPKLKGLLGGIIHLLEAMGGSYYYDKKYAGQNIFFSLSELRLHTSQLITAYEADPTSQRLLGGSYDALFGRSIGNLGEQASFRKIVSMLSGIIFHEVFGQPCPLYVPGTGGTISGFERKKITEIDGLTAVAVEANAVLDGLTKLEEDMLGVGNNLPTDIKERTKSLNVTWADYIGRLVNAQKTCKQQARKAEQVASVIKKTKDANASGIAAQAARAFKSSDGKLGQAIAYLKFSSAKSSRTPNTNALKLITQVQVELRKILNLEATITSIKDATAAVVKQQIIRPDVWFSAPPRCNVLFPDMYTSMNFSRQFMAEPTRLLLKTHDEFFGEDELFDTFYFAPKAITLKSQKNTLSSILRNDLLDHELFTGIIPVFEKMGEFNIFAARSGMSDGKEAKVGLAQRSANFLYFKYRFASRSLQIESRFNPYVACGFPGLIIDKYLDLATLKLHNELKKQLPDGQNYQTKIPNLLGTHFLASFTEVTHTLNQQQGNTSINCSYARQVDESIEFLGAQQEDVDITRKSSKNNATRTTEVAAILPPRVGAQGPSKGTILSVVDTTAKHTGKTFDNADKLPLFGGPRAKGTGKLSLVLPVGVAVSASTYGPEVTALAGDPNIIVVLRSYEITETKAVEWKETVFLPPEEYIRPGWYGDCWHPSQISKVYYDFFNTGAITEPMQVQNPAGTPGKEFASSDATQILSDVAEKGEMNFSRDMLLALSQTKESSIQDAVAFLVLTYSIIKQAGFDVDEFIRSYTWRPIASMLDMFGSSDLALDPTGRDVVQGFEGFHSRAFGPYENLFGLVSEPLESILGFGQNSPQAHKADTRKRKMQAVLDYIAVLRLSRAILG